MIIILGRLVYWAGPGYPPMPPKYDGAIVRRTRWSRRLFRILRRGTRCTDDPKERLRALFWLRMGGKL